MRRISSSARPARSARRPGDENLDCRTALLIVGSIPLAGWPPLPYGQTGNGPKHPTLRALVEGGGGVDMARL